MARREYFYNPPCVHEDCAERANYVFTTRRDQHDEMEYLRKRGGWRCVRHSRAGVVLSEDEPLREAVLVSYETDFGHGGKTHKFFRPEGATEGGNGFMHGPGFKAFAKDFPAGTRLIVTARVEVPS